jgi:hypothetical protein
MYACNVLQAIDDHTGPLEPQLTVGGVASCQEPIDGRKQP